MGDRALIHFHNGEELGPCIYLHWGGSEVGRLLHDTAERMESRGADVSYTTARCIGLAHERTDGNLSLGVFSAPDDDFAKARKVMGDDYSHGDAGVFLVDVRDWSVEHFGGYGFEHIPARRERRVLPRAEWDRGAAAGAEGVADGR